MRIRSSKCPRVVSILLLTGFSVLFLPMALFADTIFLKNKNRVDGFIEKETKDAIEINLGYGTTTFHRSEIDHIVKADTKENEAVWQKWNAEQKEIEKRKPEEERKWRERQAELERLRVEEEKLKKEQDEYGPKTITVDAKDGHFLVHVVLNDEVPVKLLIDSGASSVVLTRRVAEQLEIDVERLKKGRFQVADGRWVDMGLTTLPSVKVQNINSVEQEKSKETGIEVKNVDACVILEEPSDKDKMGDGLLGMSFLKNFKFNADYKNSTITFERIRSVPAEPAK